MPVKDNSIALIIPAYNRHESLARLLSSVGSLRPVGKDVTLIITLEGNATAEVIDIAESFTWRQGEKGSFATRSSLDCGNTFSSVAINQMSLSTLS